VDRTLNKAGYITEVVDLIVQYVDHSERATFHVTGISQMTIILGNTWLVEHNPEIDWCTGKVSLTRCPASCGLKSTANLIYWPIICWTPPRPSHAGRCALKRSWKVSQNPKRLSHHQASHIPTQMIWTEETGSSYTALVSI